MCSLICTVGNLIAIISALAAECDPAHVPKHPQALNTRFFKKGNNPPKTLFSMSLAMFAVLQMESESFPSTTFSPQQNQPPEFASSSARWACTCSSSDQRLGVYVSQGVTHRRHRRLRDPTIYCDWAFSVPFHKWHRHFLKRNPLAAD